MFDAPWTPLFLGVLFLLHPLLGVMALGGAVVLVALASINDAVSRKATQKGAQLSIRSLQDAEAAASNADSVMAMGIIDNLVQRWNRDSAAANEWMARADRLTDAETGEKYYLAQIAVREDAMNTARQPGMPSEVMVVTDRRTPMRYLLEPITKNLNRAFR